jgi:hypothetical protein
LHEDERGVQVFFLRLRTLFSPHIRVPPPLQQSLAALRIPLRLPLASTTRLQKRANRGKVTHVAQLLALDPVRGEWALDAAQRRLWPRLRANARMLVFACLVAAGAAANIALVPGLLDGAALAHPRAALAGALATDASLRAGARPSFSLSLTDVTFKCCCGFCGCCSLHRCCENAMCGVYRCLEFNVAESCKGCRSLLEMYAGSLAPQDHWLGDGLLEHFAATDRLAAAPVALASGVGGLGSAGSNQTHAAAATAAYTTAEAAPSPASPPLTYTVLRYFVGASSTALPDPGRSACISPRLHFKALALRAAFLHGGGRGLTCASPRRHLPRRAHVPRRTFALGMRQHARVRLQPRHFLYSKGSDPATCHVLGCF